jgi:hypothetical protein
VVPTVRTLAAARALTADGLGPTFLVLSANARFWASASPPASGWRTSFGGPTRRELAVTCQTCADGRHRA